jgi:hypothetical protein
VTHSQTIITKAAQGARCKARRGLVSRVAHTEWGNPDRLQLLSQRWFKQALPVQLLIIVDYVEPGLLFDVLYGFRKVSSIIWDWQIGSQDAVMHVGLSSLG